MFGSGVGAGFFFSGGGVDGGRGAAAAGAFAFAFAFAFGAGAVFTAGRAALGVVGAAPTDGRDVGVAAADLGLAAFAFGVDCEGVERS